MAFKPNYKQQRAERDRAKQARKQEKLRQRQEESEQRKAGTDTPQRTDDEADGPASA